MLNNATIAAGLSVRPSKATDAIFLEQLYHSARNDLRQIDGSEEQIADLIASQYEIQQQGIATDYPNALQFVIEKNSERIGALVTDFGHNEVRIIYLALVPGARGKSYGNAIIQGVLQAAQQVFSPVAVVVWRNNPLARQFYLRLGFTVDESHLMAERLIWYPPRAGT